jgi:hypothetical protein
LKNSKQFKLFKTKINIMLIKQLPAIGDSNWGATLNNYITQTTDNANGGGFNSFTNFADRATNFTVDDKGKTYLNNRTGNFHKWNGSAWVVNHTGGFINVQDFGKCGYGDGADDSIVIQSAINYCQDNSYGIVPRNSKLFIPTGVYYFEVEVFSQAITIFGDNGTTAVSAVNPDGYAFTFHANGTQHLEDIAIFGKKVLNNSLTYNTNGVKCVPKDSGANAGFYSVNMKRVKLDGCGIGLYKEGALFGNFEQCQFGSDVGVYSKKTSGATTVFNNNYSGFDHWIHCYWRGCENVAVFYDNNSTGLFEESQTKFDNCWFEGNRRIVFLGTGTGTSLSSTKFDHCWFEANTGANRGASLTILGNVYTVNSIILKNSKAIIEHAQIPTGISLTDHSYLKLDYVQATTEGAGINFDLVEYDSTSYVDCGILNDVPPGGYGGGINMMMEFPMRAQGTQGGINGTQIWRSKNNRSSVTRKYKNVVPWGSCALIKGVDSGPYSTSNVVANIISGDGLYGNKCLEVTIPNNTARYDPTYGVGSTKSFFVKSLSIKSNQATPATPVSIRGTDTLRGDIILKDSNWHTYCGIGSVELTTFFDFSCPTATGATTFLVSKVQIVEFDTYQEAADYAKTDFYALPNADPITWHDSAIPTTGTYAKGDVIYNTTPTPGGYMGWTCITAGTPGTWKGFGLIEA